MEIAHLTSQLKSTEILIKELVSEYYSQRGFKEVPEVKIYLKLKQGSFEEIISIILDKEVIRDVISGCLIALFAFYLANRGKKKEEVVYPKTQINIKTMVNNIKIINNIKPLSEPLEKEGDKIRIVSKRNPEAYTEISFLDKPVFREKLKEIESELKIEYSEEEFFGKLRAVDLDRETYRFSLEGTQNSVPVEFNEKINSGTVGHILDKRIKIKAIATKRNDELESLKILDFKEKEIKTLKNFSR
jgi:hypothetical protein